jgi:hypothetical protein
MRLKNLQGQIKSMEIVNLSMFYKAFACEVRLLMHLHNSLTTINTKMAQLQSRVQTERTAVQATKM